MTTPDKLAMANYQALSNNQYPGRMIIGGMDELGENMVQGYAIMGRSENSRNRIFCSDGDRLYTEAADPAKVKDPSLIIYNAMDQVEVFHGGGRYIVSNGMQTDTVALEMKDGSTLSEALSTFRYEPDEPNFTPRITAVSRISQPNLEISVIRKAAWGTTSERLLFRYEQMEKGFGFCVTTYEGDGNPLPPWRGEPLLMPLVGDIDTVANSYWQALNEANRVALAVKFIPVNDGGPSVTRIINKYTKVA